MPRLYVLSGPDVGRSYLVEDGAVLGRARDCEVSLRGTSVSRHHARIEHTNGTWRVVDLGSRNGTFAYGKRVETATLADYGAFRVGKLELRFRMDDREAAPAPAPEPVPARGVPPAARTPRQREPGPGEEVVLEEVEDLGPPVPSRTSAAPPRRRATADEPRAAAFLGADLGQRSAGMQLLLVALVVLVALVLAWGTFALVTWLRAG